MLGQTRDPVRPWSPDLGKHISMQSWSRWDLCQLIWLLLLPTRGRQPISISGMVLRHLQRRILRWFSNKRQQQRKQTKIRAMESLPSIIASLTPLLVWVQPIRNIALIKMLRSASLSISQRKKGQLLKEASIPHQLTRRVRQREVPGGFSMSHQHPHFWLQELITPKLSQ